MTKVCLIDGSGYIFRAFYALPEMTSPQGLPVNAVYGFLTMFMRLLKNIPCDYCVVLFDAKRENFRNEIFAQYKTNRAETPELLIPQFPLIRKAVEVMGLHYVEQEGYEADDLIATYAKLAADKGFDVTIVSADKDLMQLIRPGITFYDGMKDKFFTPDDVKEKFGVYPDKVVDVQALSGDKIDNVPGVPGIGPKTAAELVNQYGSLEAVLTGAAEMKPSRRRDLLLQYSEDARVSLRLVTLKNDVPIQAELEEFHCCAPIKRNLMEFVDELGFKSIRTKLEQWADERGCGRDSADNTPPKIEATQVHYEKITSPQQLEALKNAIYATGKMAFQVVGNNEEFAGISISTGENSASYIPLPSDADDDLFGFGGEKSLAKATISDFLQKVLNDKRILKIAADIKTQWHLLDKLCADKADLFPYDDIAIMSYDLDSSEHEHTLEAISAVFLQKNLVMPKAANKREKINFEADEYDGYVYKVSDYVMQLQRILRRRLFTEKKSFVYESIDRRLAAVLRKMENTGIMVDVRGLQELDKEFEVQLKTIEHKVYELAGEEFNLNSPQQVGAILYQKFGLKGKKTASGKFNTSAEVLETMSEESELAAKILEWRMYAKLKTTYTSALLEVKDAADRVHTTFAQTVVNTGRLASSNPNLQNIPNRSEIGRKIKKCFVARPGYKLVAADYSQMELRLMAEVAGVSALKEAFAGGIDVHSATAARVFNIPYEQVDREHRSRAKAINFGIIYGISQFGLAKQIGISREDAKRYIESYFQIMPEVKKYMEQTIDFARTNGYVCTKMGRKCFIAGINDSNQRIVSFAQRAAINAPIQGGAADIVKLAMLRIDKALEKYNGEVRLLLQVHDELVLEAREDLVEEIMLLLKTIMENVVAGDVKLSVEVGSGSDWSMAH